MWMIRPVLGIEGIQNHHQIHQPPQCDEQHRQPVDVGKSNSMNTDFHRLILYECLIEEISDEGDRTIERLTDEPDSILLHINRIKASNEKPTEEKKENPTHDEESSSSLTENDVTKTGKHPGHEGGCRAAAPLNSSCRQLIIILWSGHADRPNNSGLLAMISGCSLRPEQIRLKFRITRAE
tara:strand:- start:1024 stop:1566 length:543 start_codon:yes stop_codon:yes gene_type:complete